MEDWVRLGDEAKERHDYKKAFEYYKNAADAGNSDCMTAIGLMYEDGEGVKKDVDQAFHWYSKAAEHGNTNAMIQLGICYDYGEGIEKDPDKALEWAEKALAAGDEDAHWWIGAYLLFYKKEFRQAFEHFEKAAMDGNINQNDAENTIGDYYYYGYDGVERDYSTAVGWYSKAAEHGHPFAMIALGKCYELGIGVEQNLAKARDWCQKASVAGLKEGVDLLLKMWDTHESIH